MPSYRITINFVQDVPDTLGLILKNLNTNSSIGVYINDVLFVTVSTDNNGNANENIIISDNYQADLLNHGAIHVNFVEAPISGVIGFVDVDDGKIELRYV